MVMSIFFSSHLKTAGHWMAKDKGESVYIEKGDNRWSAVHRADAAVLYRMIIEQQPGQKVFHAVAETGIPFRLIAEAIGNGLHISTVIKLQKMPKNILHGLHILLLLIVGHPVIKRVLY